MNPRPRRRPNVLLVTLDQFRGDSLGVAGHPVARTPNLDRLAGEGLRLASHYSQTAPCGPGRASLYTGLYQFNHRVVANGTPLDRRFDNIAKLARRAGYQPVLFGYTDQTLDPRDATGPDDPRLGDWEGVLPGFDSGLDLTSDHEPWCRWLEEMGHDTSVGVERLLATEADRPAALSVSTFLTDRLLEWLRWWRAHVDAVVEPWFAHASYLRPHPPFSAAGEWSDLVDPTEAGDPIEPIPDSARHPFHTAALEVPEAAAPTDPDKVGELRAQYFGMIGEVDAQLGRLWWALEDLDWWDDTVVVVTSDHGEQLGDHGLVGKLGYFEESYHIPGIVRDPSRPMSHGVVLDHFTENVDLFPTLAELVGEAVPRQCDGRSLVPFLDDVEPIEWRDAAHWEFDWRDIVLSMGARAPRRPDDRTLERHHLAVVRKADAAYVRFGDGTSLAFDLEEDPTWRTPLDDCGARLGLAEAMLDWRAEHTDRTFTSPVVGPVS